MQWLFSTAQPFHLNRTFVLHAEKQGRSEHIQNLGDQRGNMRCGCLSSGGCSAPGDDILKSTKVLGLRGKRDGWRSLRCNHATGSKRVCWREPWLRRAFGVRLLSAGTLLKKGHGSNDCLVQMREDAFQKAVSVHQKAAITKRFLEHGGLLCGSCSASTGRT